MLPIFETYWYDTLKLELIILLTQRNVLRSKSISACVEIVKLASAFLPSKSLARLCDEKAGMIYRIIN